MTKLYAKWKRYKERKKYYQWLKHYLRYLNDRQMRYQTL